MHACLEVFRLADPQSLALKTRSFQFLLILIFSVHSNVQWLKTFGFILLLPTERFKPSFELVGSLLKVASSRLLSKSKVSGMLRSYGTSSIRYI